MPSPVNTLVLRGLLGPLLVTDGLTPGLIGGGVWTWLNNHNGTVSGNNTAIFTLPNPVVAGDLIVVPISTWASTPVAAASMSVADNKGNGPYHVGSWYTSSPSGNMATGAFWNVVTIGGTGLQLTVTAPAGTYVTAMAGEFGFTPTSAVVAVDGTGGGSGTSGPASLGSNLAANGTDLFIAVLNSPGAVTPSVGPGYSQLDWRDGVGGNESGYSEYKLNVVAAEDPSFTLGTSGEWQMSGVSFILTGAAPVGIAPGQLAVRKPIVVPAWVRHNLSTGAAQFVAGSSPIEYVPSPVLRPHGQPGIAARRRGSVRIVRPPAPAAAPSVGTMAATLGSDAFVGTGSASAPSAAAGTMGVTLTGDAFAGSATAGVAPSSAGTMAATLVGDIFAGSATAAVAPSSAGTMGVTLASATFAGSATAGVAPSSAGTMAATLGNDIFAGTGSASTAGAAAGTMGVTLAGATFAGSGSAGTAAPSAGTMAVTLVGDAFAGSATALPPASAGTMSVTLAGATFVGSGTAGVAPSSAGTMAATLGSDVFAGSGSATAPAGSAATMAVTLADATFAGTGTATAPSGSAATMAVVLAGATFAGSGSAGLAAPSAGTMAATLAGDIFHGTAIATAPSAAAGTMAATLTGDIFRGSGTAQIRIIPDPSFVDPMAGTAILGVASGLPYVDPLAGTLLIDPAPTLPVVDPMAGTLLLF